MYFTDYSDQEMGPVWQRFGIGRKQHYELERLIDYRHRFEGKEAVGEQIICDIDKTYLETEFDSWLQIARTALEDPEDKITVAGAAEVLMGMRWGGVSALSDDQYLPRPLHFVSSSPPQMRGKLEEKMLLDGIDWSSDTFKNQAYNLMTGRMDLLRQHVAYKSAAILRIMSHSGPDSRFHLIGDSAESDAFTYFGVFLFSSGLLTHAGYQSFLESAGVDVSLAKSLLQGYESATERNKLGKVASIAIRQLPKSPIVEHAGMTEYLDRFTSFPELGFIFIERGIIDAQYIGKWLVQFNHRHRVPAEKLLIFIRAMQKTLEQPHAPNTNDIVLKAALASAEQRLSPLVKNADIQAFYQLSETENELRASLGRRSKLRLTDDRGALAALGENGILEQCRLWFERSHQAKRNR